MKELCGDSVIVIPHNNKTPSLSKEQLVRSSNPNFENMKCSSPDCGVAVGTPTHRTGSSAPLIYH